MSEDWRQTTSFGNTPPPYSPAPGPSVSGPSVSGPSVSGPSVSYVPTNDTTNDTTNFTTNIINNTPSVAKERLYYPAPPIIQTYHQYQDVNNDKNLQNMETVFFLKRTIECIDYDKSWKGLNKFKKYLNGNNGYEIIHKLLKLFVRRGNTNWYDLKVQKDLVLDYIKHKLSKL